MVGIVVCVCHVLFELRRSLELDIATRAPTPTHDVVFVQHMLRGSACFPEPFATAWSPALMESGLGANGLLTFLLFKLFMGLSVTRPPRAYLTMFFQ